MLLNFYVFVEKFGFRLKDCQVFEFKSMVES